MTSAAEIRVRPARLEDGPAAAALLREIDDLHAAIAPAYFCAGARAQSEWRGLLEDGTALALVAEAGPGGLAGLLVVRIYDTPQSPTMVPRRRGHVESVVVAAGRRRRGVGRRLMDEAGAWARAAGAVELVLTIWEGNADAEAFYARIGHVLSYSLLGAPLVYLVWARAARAARRPPAAA